MATYRQIRPSWIAVPTPRADGTVIISTPAAAPSAAQAPAAQAPAAAPAAPAPSGTSAIYQQVITSLQNQVNTLLTMYLENPPAPAQVYYEPPRQQQVYYEPPRQQQNYYEHPQGYEQPQGHYEPPQGYEPQGHYDGGNPYHL